MELFLAYFYALTAIVHIVCNRIFIASNMSRPYAMIGLQDLVFMDFGNTYSALAVLSLMQNFAFFVTNGLLNDHINFINVWLMGVLATLYSVLFLFYCLLVLIMVHHRGQFLSVLPDSTNCWIVRMICVIISVVLCLASIEEPSDLLLQQGKQGIHKEGQLA
jgi:hypothetical protein